MKSDLSFILVDNDPINNMINKKMISLAFQNALINEFIDPFEALKFFMDNKNELASKKSVLFLDINMPEMTGWEFLKLIEEANSIAKENLIIYMLSSSAEPLDLQKTRLNKYVLGFIHKPISIKFLTSLKD